MLLLGLALVSTGGFRDYPCGRVYDDQSDCLLPRRENDAKTRPRIHLFQSVFWANWSGGGCDDEQVETDALTLGLLPRLERDGDRLRIRGRLLDKGETFESYVFDPHPWTSSFFEVTNRGVVRVCNREEIRPDGYGYTTFSGSERLLVTGSRGTKFALIKGLSTLLALFAALVLLERVRNRAT